MIRQRANRLQVRHHLVPTLCPAGDEIGSARIVDADPLVQQLFTAKAQRGDAPPSFGPNLEFP